MGHTAVHVTAEHIFSHLTRLDGLPMKFSVIKMLSQANLNLFTSTCDEQCRNCGLLYISEIETD